MGAREIEKKFIQFFVDHHHLNVPQVSLVPENDPTLLFTSAGMVQFKPFFLGLEKPPAPRMVNIQRCLRTTDIDKVGNNARTLSFFEMLGSWSIGDYFKEEAINLAWQFLTGCLGFEKKQLWATYFAGDPEHEQISPDRDSAKFWRQAGLNSDHLVGLGYQDNFWQAAETGPCGPSTEVYLDRGESFGCGRLDCRPGCDCDRFIEIWNAGVFMQYDRTADNDYRPLPFNSVDTGAGLERLAMVLQGKDSVFETDLLQPLVDQVLSQTGINYLSGTRESCLVNRIVDHTKASVFLVADGVLPANQEQGYILRRLIRRAADAAGQINLPGLEKLAAAVIEVSKEAYPYLTEQAAKIRQIISQEETGYRKTISRGMRTIASIAKKKNQEKKPISGREIFYFTQTLGLQPELVKTEFEKLGIGLTGEVDQEFFQAQEDHRKRSRSNRKFKGGLADDSFAVIAYHTATHLLHQALRQVLGDHVHQVGSNITSQRLRFDFTYPKALAEEEIRKIERIVNEQIRANLPVSCQEESLSSAKASGALAFFEKRYDPGKVKVYRIGNFSQEVCGGPHVDSTGKLGRFSIDKEKSIGSGKRRIYGILKRD